MAENRNIGERNILVAADASENGERAVLYVADMLGGLPGFRATLLHVIAEPPEDFFATEEEEKKWLEDETAKGTRLVKRYRTLLMQAGFEEDKVSTEILVRRCDSVASCIIGEAERLNACTVAVGRRGLTSKEEFLEGSTSSRLLHTAKNCALWVVE
jgi:nucleotide-binding universal stress UspA family protein